MHAEPQQEHQWLQQLVGQWTQESEAVMGPGESPMHFTGTAVGRSLGGMWVLIEGEMPGERTDYSIITLGYDPGKQRYVGTFVGSMMPKLWLYEGTLDAEKKILTLDSEGPNFTGDGTALYQDIFEIAGPDHWILRSQIQGPDGSWTHFMTAHNRRVK